MLCQNLIRLGSRAPTQTRKVQYSVRSARDTLADFVLPKPAGKPLNLTEIQTSQTVLDGGVKVISVDTPTPVTSVSVYLEAGSRFENYQTLGSSHFLKYLPLRGTHQKSGLRLIRDLEHIGATLTSNATREHVSYHVKSIRLPDGDKVQVELAIIAESLRFLLNPTIHEFQVSQVKASVEADTTHASPLAVALDQLHAESFRDAGLGNPLLCPSYALADVNPQKIHTHVKNNFFPGNRITVVGTGIEHTTLLAHVKPLFTDAKLEGRFFELAGLKPLPEETISQETSFTGGSNIRLPSHSNTTVAVAFPGAGRNHADSAVFGVLKEALGCGQWGNSIGSGISSPLNKLVKETHPFLQQASALNLSYADAGLFVLFSHAEVGNAGAVANALVQQALGAVSSLTEDDIVRAKNTLKFKQIKSGLSDGLAIAEHIATYGNTYASYFKKVDSVTLADVQRVAKTFSSVKPNVVSSGDVRGVKL